jgi:hypothetical protein
MAAARTRRTMKIIVMTRSLAARPPRREAISSRDPLKMITEAVATNALGHTPERTDLLEGSRGPEAAGAET